MYSIIIELSASHFQTHRGPKANNTQIILSKYRNVCLCTTTHINYIIWVPKCMPLHQQSITCQVGYWVTPRQELQFQTLKPSSAGSPKQEIHLSHKHNQASTEDEQLPPLAFPSPLHPILLSQNLDQFWMKMASAQGPLCSRTFARDHDFYLH